MIDATVAKLGDVCTFIGGGTPSRERSDFFDGNIPWATVKDFKKFVLDDTEEHINEAAVAASASNVVDAGTVLLVTRVGLGKVAIAGVPLAINQDIKALTPKPHLLPEYLFWFLVFKADAIKKMGVGATVKGVTLNDVKAIQIPIPSIDRQRSIIDLLSRAEGIVRLRRDAQKKAAELVPAIFLEMFGDPATNPKNFSLIKLGNYLGINSVVRTPDLATEKELPCIGADSIESGKGKFSGWTTVGDVLPRSGKYWFEAGDVLYSKIRPALCKVAIPKSAGYCSADMYPLSVGKRATPEFVHSLLLSKAFTSYAVGQSIRAQMPKLNREKLFAYEHPMPSIELQLTFSARMQAVDAIYDQQQMAIGVAEQTFNSLLHRQFSN